jgi:mono/diheme cytochrome c family protein
LYEKIFSITKARKLENTKSFLLYFVFSSFRVFVIDRFWFRLVRVRGEKMLAFSRSIFRNKGMIFIIGLLVSGTVLISQAAAQTYVSGKVFTSDGMVVASGAVALEKGELHNNAFLAGGAIGSDGTFKIPLPSGGPWGLHVYSEKYIYFPLQIQIKAGVDNDIPVILPVDGTTTDDPRISDIKFTKLSDQVFQIAMQVADPNNNLGPQMLAIDTKRFKSYRLVPKAGDLKDMKADFPTGEYVSPFIPVALDKEDLNDWLFAVADHQCSNGAIYNGRGQSVFKPTVAHSETLACEVPGIWKSNFDKIYQFSQTAPGAFAGEQFEGNLVIDKMEQAGDRVLIAFGLEGKKGTAELLLRCREKQVLLKGTFQYPDRSGDWVFSKLKNAKAPLTGRGLFEANCAICHYHDRKDKKVGPGLAELFKSPKLPDSGLPVTEENVRERIVKGGDKMPSFKHLKDDELKAIIDYLKEL